MVRFSRTVSSGSRLSCCGQTPSRARIAGPSRTGSRPRMRSSPPVGGETQPIIRMVERLAGAVGPEEAERLARPHVDVDPVDRGEVAEALDQPAGVDQGFVSHAPDPNRRRSDNPPSVIADAPRPRRSVPPAPRRPARSVASTTARRRPRRCPRRSGPSRSGRRPRRTRRADHPHARRRAAVVRGVRDRAGHPRRAPGRGTLARLEQQARRDRPRRPSPCSRPARATTSAGVTTARGRTRPPCGSRASPAGAPRRAATARGWWRPRTASPGRRRRGPRPAPARRRSSARPAAGGQLRPPTEQSNIYRPSRRLLAQRAGVLLQREQLAEQREVLVLVGRPG